MKSNTESSYIVIDGKRIHYLTAGHGQPILLIHGWPTSAYLWRNLVEDLGNHHRAIAIDLPGFGNSDKDPSWSYSFRFYSRILDGFVDQLQLKNITLGVHDLGGPIGLFWMVNNMDKVERLLLFNTLVYPKLSWAVKAFGLATVLPGVRNWISSPAGIRWAMRLGVHQKSNLTDEIIQSYQEPFNNRPDRKSLLKSVQRLSKKGFLEIENRLKEFAGPVLILYGEKDRILPDVALTMARVQQELPRSKVVSFDNAGHFLQEDVHQELNEEIKIFMQS